MRDKNTALLSVLLALIDCVNLAVSFRAGPLRARTQERLGRWP